MPKTSPRQPRPTEGELSILRVLWDHGPCTVRQVRDHLRRNDAYTTILKLLQIMTVKRLVRREQLPPPARGHLYSAAQPANVTLRRIVKNLLEKAFAGSAANLLLQALAAKRATPRELAEIRRLLDEYEKGDQP